MWERLGPIFLAALPLLGYYLWTVVYAARVKRFAAWPQAKSSLLWGHMMVLQKRIMSGDPDRDIDMVMTSFHRELGRPGAMVFDLWPVMYPMAVITSHEVAEQITKPSKAFPWSLTKSPTLGEMRAIIGKHSILTLEGEEWKSLRRRFNPGFSPSHLMTLLPCILDKTQFFLEHLDNFCRTGEEFRMDGVATNLTFDVIGAVTMDIDFGAQFNDNRRSELITLYTKLLQTYTTGASVVSGPKFGTRLKRWRLSRRIDVLLKDLVRQRFAQLKAERKGADDDAFSARGAPPKSRSVVSLSLQDTEELDDDLLQKVCDQLKTFLLAGHDTTSILLQWAFYELWRTPHALARLRAELDDIFGPDPDPAVVRAQLLERGEELVRRMTYTSAVVKELLRMYAPAGTARRAKPGSGFTVRLPDGKELLLDGCIVYICANIIQRDEAIYGENAQTFTPERWLHAGNNVDTSMRTNAADGGGAATVAVDEKSAEGKTIPAGAWRPFERGPRNCIGQELANIEARVILACCVRRYDFIKRGLGQLDLDESGEPVLLPNGQYKVKAEMYSTRQVTPKPIDGTRVRVKFSEAALAAGKV